MKRESVGRRDFIKGTATAAFGLSAGSLVRASTPSEIALPLPYTSLDPEHVRQLAYNQYFQGGCMHGASSGLILAFKEAFAGQGTGWDMIPLGMYKYGSGGVSGWGTICGVLNGVMAVLNLVDLHGKLGNELMGWYSTTLFPTDNCDGFVAVKTDGTVLATAIPDALVLAHTVSDSPLCHISISKWCHEAGVSVADATTDGLKYKDDRCSKICADTAAKTAELINQYVASYAPSEDFAACLACHSQRKDQIGQMNCTGCHTNDAVLVPNYHPAGKMGKGKTGKGK
jgi:hypothetical protein